jgi:site-specific DNA-methyltransferase (adenine-specific)
MRNPNDVNPAPVHQLVGLRPFYDEAGITIYHADCAQVLPFLEPVDLLLTDPPYGMEFQSNYRTKKHDKIIGDDALPLGRIHSAIDKATVASYIFCRWDNIPQMPKPKSVLAWVKNNWSMGDLEHEHGRMWEACLFYPGVSHAFTRRIPDVIMCERTGNELHPTQKPTGVMSQIIDAYASTATTILDPFMGSGTTLVAAKNLGKRAIGIERELKYCEIAVRRLAQQTLFQVEQSNAKDDRAGSQP